MGPSGSHDLTVIPDLPTGQASAPVRLIRRKLYHMDDPAHRRTAQQHGYRDGFHVLFDVTENWSDIRRSLEDPDRVVLVRPLKDADAVVVLELSKADNAPYWDIHSTGLRNKKQLGSILYVRESITGGSAASQVAVDANPKAGTDPITSPTGDNVSDTQRNY